MVITKSIHIDTAGDCDIIDITPAVAREISNSPISNGAVTIFITGSTAGITTIEYEPGLMADLKIMFDRIIPKNIRYEHDRAWNDGNGYAHVSASLLGPSLTVPILKKRLTLGTWQQVVVIDFDNRPRSRDIVLQISGE